MEKNLLPKRKRTLFAQAASELAIFGSILIFLIGGLIRIGFQQSMSMDAQLRALRLALSESWRTSQGKYNYNRTSIARNSAKILLIEDRLSVDSGQKYGTRDRIPFVTSGIGTLSQNLFYSFDWNSRQDVPVYDVFVNGQRFPLTTGAFKIVTLPTDDALIRNSAPARDQPHPGGKCYDNSCYLVGGMPKPCLVFFERRYNYNGSGYDPSQVTMFDLNLDGTIDPAFVDDLDHPNPYAAQNRAFFTWQWVPRAAINGTTLTSAIPGSQLFPADFSKPVDMDVDGDGQEESIFRADYSGPRVSTLYVYDTQDGDIDAAAETEQSKPEAQQLGIQKDATMYSYTKANATPGDKAHQGTYYRIEEGKLFSMNGQFIRNTTRTDHVDIVMRVLRLSNNTERFCPDPSLPHPNAGYSFRPRVWTPITGNPDPIGAPAVSGVYTLNNPVEACGETPSGGYSTCFDSDKIEKTCMDVTQKVIFIRSRLENLRGQKWVTRMDLDQ